MRFLILPVLAAVTCCAADVDFQSERVRIQYDGRFQAHVRWLGDRDGNVISFDPAAQEMIEVNGWPLSEFRINSEQASRRRVTDPEFGPALEGVVTGVLRDESRLLHLERRVRLLFPDKFPDAVIFEKTYRNLGARPVRLGRVDSQRLLLDRSLAEPREESWSFASFQGGAYRWGLDYSLIWLRPGFRQSNFQGLDNRTGPEGEGGGMPFIDVWAPAMGVALAHLEKAPQWVSLPVTVRPDGRTEIAISEEPLAKFKQREWLKPGESFPTVLTAMIFHHGDYFDALQNYGRLLRARGVAIPETSPPSAYKPYWKSWGFEFDFTQEKILALLPELKSMGIELANLDDGWFDYYGDWQVNRSPGKFPGGDPDIKEFVRKFHAAGFRTGIWWYPLGVSVDSRLAKERPELMVQDENGAYVVDDRKVHQLCPAFEPARRHIRDLLRRFILDYGFDGVYIDSVGLTAVPPCFNPAHGHKSPLDSFQSLPLMFKEVHDDLYRMKPDPYLEVCICAMPHSPYNMPYYPIANASDPVNLAQVRQRVKLEKAIRGPRFCVGDCYQVPMDEWHGASVPESFESAMGTGAQLTTYYADLTDEQRSKWRRWFRMYNELGLASAKFLNLYDIAFDKPEVHAVRKGNDFYYGIFADFWSSRRRIELRGLDRETTYTVFDYANNRSMGTISGAQPYLAVSFKESLLVRVSPVKK